MKATNYELEGRPGIVALNEKDALEIDQVSGGWGDGGLKDVVTALVAAVLWQFSAFVWSSPAEKQAAVNRFKTGCVSLAGVLKRGEVADIFYSAADANAGNPAFVSAANTAANNIAGLPTTATATQIATACTPTP